MSGYATQSSIHLLCPNPEKSDDKDSGKIVARMSTQRPPKKTMPTPELMMISLLKYGARELPAVAASDVGQLREVVGRGF